MATETVRDMRPNERDATDREGDPLDYVLGAAILGMGLLVTAAGSAAVTLAATSLLGASPHLRLVLSLAAGLIGGGALCLPVAEYVVVPALVAIGKSLVWLYWTMRLWRYRLTGRR